MSPEPKTAVVCDTTAYLPIELVELNDINLVSLYVTLEGRQEAESEIADLTDFYDRLRLSEEGATTSQPSVGDLIAVYDPLLEQGLDIASLHISAGISGTYEAAIQARDRLQQEGKGGERIRVFDSQSSAGGLGLLALAASAAARAGGGGDAVIDRVKRARDAVKIWFAVDTLEYLRRGGRIGAARAWIGSTLQIKPILTLEEEITPVERVRTRSRSIDRLVEYAKERHEAGADGWVVQYIQDREAADNLIERCREVFGCDPVFVSEIGPVLGAHVGPGLLGVGGLPRKLLD
jgi:DegV family protein with EDD domain